MSRETFEAWFKSSFHPDKTGPYVKDQLFCAWQAATASMQVERYQLAAECAALKSVDTWMNADEVGGAAAEKAIEEGSTPNEATREGVKAVIDSIKTPATDRFLAEQRAIGVDMLVEECESDIMLIEPEDEEHYTLMIEYAKEFAAQLRNEVKV